MKDTARTVLTEAGINVDTALKRFLDDEEMYFEFFKFICRRYIDEPVKTGGAKRQCR